MGYMDLPPDKQAEIDRLIEETSGGHEDEAQDVELIREIVGEIMRPVLELICAKIDEQAEGLSKLTSVVMDEIIGGVKKLYDSNQRRSKLESLRERLAPELGEYEDGFKAAYPNADLYEGVLSMLDERRGEEGFDEEAALPDVVGKIRGLMDGIKEKLGAKSIKGEIVAEGVPDSNAEDFLAQLAEDTRRRAKRA